MIIAFLKAFLYVYLIGAFLLNNLIGCVVIRLNEKSKFLVMGGIHKIRIFNQQRRIVALKKKDRYSVILVIWQLFWIFYLIIAPLFLKVFSFIIPVEVIYFYLQSLKKISDIFFIEMIMIAIEAVLEVIIYGH